MGGYSLYQNASSGNWGAAALDVGGMVADVAAIATPGVPGGAGMAIKAGRLSDLAQANKVGGGAGADDFVDLATSQRRNHILDGDATGGGHRPGTGISGKSEFPEGWSDDRIMHEISDIATDPSSLFRAGRGGRVIAEGTREGIDIRVILGKDGEIVSGFPTNVPRNP